MGRPKKIKPTGPVEINTGFLVVNCSKAQGGVQYTRTIGKKRNFNNGKGSQADIRTHKTIDHVEVVEAIDALVKKADYACRKHCTWTTFGWFTDEVNELRLRKEIGKLQRAAKKLNSLAIQLGSERTVEIAVIPATIVVANEDVARQVAKTIRDVLVEVRNALRSGNVRWQEDMQNALHAPLLKCRNLDRLAVGIAGEAVTIALDRIPVAKKEILLALKQGTPPEEAGAAVDLGAIENAIEWFREGRIGGGRKHRDPIKKALAMK